MILLGYGWAASMHARAAKVAGIEVVGVAGHNIARTQTFAEQHGIAHATEDWRTVRSASSERLLDVLDSPWNHHADRRLPIIRSIGRVQSTAAAIETDFAADNASEICGERVGVHREAPRTRSGARRTCDWHYRIRRSRNGTVSSHGEPLAIL